MFDTAQPDRSDLALRIPADAYCHLVHTLRLALPPPPVGTPGPEDFLRRDHAAIASIAALAPANAAEADVAAQFVAASEHWKHCLRLAQLPEPPPQWAAKCGAQGMAMMRQANAALRLLLRMQDARRKLEADDTARDRLAWTEHCALGLMAQALAGAPQNPACPDSAVADAPTPKPQPHPEPAEKPAAEPALPKPRSEAAAAAAAAEYVVLYPERAALIRRLGRVPDDAPFGRPDDDIVQALIAGPSACSLARDRASPEARAA